MIDRDVEARILEAFGPTFDRAALGMARVGSESVREVLETATPSGRTYVKDGRRRRASAPGEPPADHEGALAGSWTEAPPERDERGSRSASFSRRSLSAVLEFGDPPHLAPRPHARPGLSLAERKLKADLAQVLR